MTERKPPGVSWETWIERQIRQGMEQGEFDDLPGHGKPLRDIDQPRDELWWVRDKLVGAINDRIVTINSQATTGPPSTVVKLDVEAEVQRWLAAQRQGQ